MTQHWAAKVLACAAAVAAVVQGGSMHAQTGLTARNPLGVFLRCTGQDDPLRALQAVRSLGLDTIQVSKLPDRFYMPAGAASCGDAPLDRHPRRLRRGRLCRRELRRRDTVVRTVGFRPLAPHQGTPRVSAEVRDFADAIGAGIVTFHMGFLPPNPETRPTRRC